MIPDLFIQEEMTGDHIVSLDISMSSLKSKWPLEMLSNLSPQLQNLLEGILPDMGRKCCAFVERLQGGICEGGALSIFLQALTVQK